MKEHTESKNQIKTSDVNIRRRRKKKIHFGWLYLFAAVFAFSFFLLLRAVETYSPDVDVQIGEKEELTLNSPDLVQSSGYVDDRLRWIQSEDDMPAAEYKFRKFQLPESFNYMDLKQSLSEEDKKQQDNIQIEPEKFVENKNVHVNDVNSGVKDLTVNPDSDKTKVSKNDGKIADKTKEFQNTKKTENLKNNKKENPEITVTVTKVYAGNYSTFEEAAEAQKKLSSSKPELAPFVKSKGGRYYVQAGSFYDSQKADSLVNDLKSQGFSAKKYSE